MNLLQLMNDVKEEQQKNAKINKGYVGTSDKARKKLSLKKTYAFEQAYSSFHHQMTSPYLFQEIKNNNPDKFCRIVTRFNNYKDICTHADFVLIVNNNEYLLNRTTMLDGFEEYPFENDDWLLIYLNSRRTKEGLVYTNLEQSEEFVMPAIVEHAIESYAKRYEIDPKDPTRVYMHSKEKDDRYL